METHGNNLNNLPPFYVGQKVICILPHSTNSLLKVGEIYTIKEIYKCCIYSLNVGIPTTNNKGTFCYHCNTNISEREAFFNANKFKSLQEQSFPLIEYSEVLEKETVSCN